MMKASKDDDDYDSGANGEAVNASDATKTSQSMANGDAHHPDLPHKKKYKKGVPHAAGDDMPHESRTTLPGSGGGRNDGNVDLNRGSANRTSKQTSNEGTGRSGTLRHQMKSREDEAEEEEDANDDDENPNPQSSNLAKNQQQQQPRKQLETTVIGTALASNAHNANEQSDMEEDDHSQSVPTLQEKLRKATEWTDELLQLKSQINQTRIQNAIVLNSLYGTGAVALGTDEDGY